MRYGRRVHTGTSETASNRSRPRKGSIRQNLDALNPFLRTPKAGRERSGSLLQRITGGRKSTTISESPEVRGGPSAGQDRESSGLQVGLIGGGGGGSPSRSRRGSAVPGDELMMGERK